MHYHEYNPPSLPPSKKKREKRIEEAALKVRDKRESVENGEVINGMNEIRFCYA